MDNTDLRIYLMKTIKNTSSLVENQIKTNGKYYNKRKEYYNIKEYIDKFLENYNTDKFFILPGLRGVGKTTIIYQLIHYLYTECELNISQILYLNLDRLKNKGKIDLQLCMDIFIRDINEKQFINNEPLFIFVDEIQHITDWGLVGKIVYDETVNVFMVFSGSNALNLITDKDSARRSLKREVSPLSFSEYLYLKYYCDFPSNMVEILTKMILTGNIKEISTIEKEIQTQIFLNLKRDIKKEWEDFIQSGGLPHTFNKNLIDTVDYTLETKDRIVERDIPLISSLNTDTLGASHPLLDIIALQKPGTLSEQRISNNLNIPKSEVHTLLNLLEKTLIIFHIEPYGSKTKRVRQAWEYYYFSTQMKSCIFLTDGKSTEENKEYWGILLENYVAFSIFRLLRETIYKFSIFFDPRSGGVDFIINTSKGKIIPIEVGIGKKKKRQIISAINHYKSDYGIVISNATDRIIKEDKVIFIPYTTFSLF
ncbi:MAG: hypothetical protein BZ136_01190 [Methanosphaera sp. rholeuAM74]|nr:MAG: hypothetical protein BZ136_01190 [Methanosphaera sp. rholeuAM74]